jgi:methionine sulfoxide reductase heme-binding subunit
MNKQEILKVKVAIWLLALMPLLRLIWLGVNDDLGANPVEFVERSTGTWTLVILLVTLSMTPIRLLTGVIWQVQLRRLLGLFMFFYACLHITTYVWLDYSFVWKDIVKDIIKHPYVIVGFSAFILTIPLAATSNNIMMRRLKSNWKILHKAVYLIAILGVLHFWWLVKKDVTEPLYYAFTLAVLLGIRLYYKQKSKPRVAQTQKPTILDAQIN